LNTFDFGVEIRYDIADPHVDDTKEALVLLLELSLVKDLHREDAVFVDATKRDGGSERAGSVGHSVRPGRDGGRWKQCSRR
jgi:hypothetical protein